MMTKGILRNAILALALVIALAPSADAKIKGLPAIKSFKDFELKKNNVASVKYMIYAPVDPSAQNPVKGQLADFGIEAFFDQKGNRIKETVFHIENGSVESTTDWTYDEKQGTVTEVRSNPKGELVYRIEYLVNYKAGTVLSRKFENILSKGEVVGSMMVEEELWSEDAKKKTAVQKKTYFVLNNGEPLAERQSIKEFEIDKPNTFYSTMDEFSGPVDCPWLVDHNAATLKTTTGKSKKEAVYNGDKVEYLAKKGLLVQIKTTDKDKVLKNDVIISYSFDKAKNWTEALQKENNKVRFLVERTINYYN